MAIAILQDEDRHRSRSAEWIQAGLPHGHETTPGGGGISSLPCETPGHDRSRVDLDRLTGPADAGDDDLIDLDDALDRLAHESPLAAELVKMRFFAGMTLGEAADALGIPRRTADRHWAFARAWLADALADG